MTAPARAERRLLTFKQACAYLGNMPEARLRRLVHARKIPCYRDGRLFFMSDELDEWLIEHRRPADGDQRRETERRVPARGSTAPAWQALMPAKRRFPRAS